jgi:hypothetical protein
MITIADSIPRRSNKGLQGQDILWTQFNDISFFIEDDFQENLYFQILKKLFPNVKLSKIFPLGGKTSIIKKAIKCSTNNKKVFILDNDFDEILNLKETLPNLFYLQRYSIENYLFEPASVYELIKEENTKVKLRTIKNQFNFFNFINDCSSILLELSAHFFLIRKFELGIKYLNIDPHRDCDWESTPNQIKITSVRDFYLNVENSLKLKRPRIKYSKQLVLARKHFKATKAIINIPGKYLANLLKVVLKKIFNFVQCSIDSFIYRLMKNCSLTSLHFLKDAIEVYVG